MEDVFGVAPGISVDGNQKSKSRCGLLLTILLSMFLVFLVYHETIDTFAKQNPEVVTSVTSSRDPPIIQVKPSTFNFAFGVRNQNTGKYIADDTGFYNIKVYSTIRKQSFDYDNDEYEQEQEKNILKYSRCDDGDFTGPFNFIETDLLPTSYCISLDNPNPPRLEGTHASTERHSIEVVFSLCDDEDDPSSVPCKSEEQIEDAFENAKLEIEYTGYRFDPENYETPISYF